MLAVGLLGAAREALLAFVSEIGGGIFAKLLSRSELALRVGYILASRPVVQALDRFLDSSEAVYACHRHIIAGIRVYLLRWMLVCGGHDAGISLQACFRTTNPS